MFPDLPLRSLLAAALSFPFPAPSPSSVLPPTYLNPHFLQPLPAIQSYTRLSIASLLLAVNHTNGQFLDGIPDPVGNQFFWQTQNGLTAVAGDDASHHKNEWFLDIVAAQNALARYPGDGYESWGVALVNTYNDDAAWAALSNLQAYEAYGRDIFLQRALGVWEFLSTHGYIGQSVIDAGHLEGVKYPNITLQAECNGKSMLGGVYWVNGGVPSASPGIFIAANSGDVNAVSTGNFALLSAELCRVMGEAKFCDYAYASAQWLDRHMVDTETGLLWDHLDGTSCALANHTFTYNVGLYIATYAVLGHLTSNHTATALAERAAVAAMTNSIWNTPQGIIHEGEGPAGGSVDPIGFKSIMIRYLHKAHPWLRDRKVRDAIVRYINIQYYALVNFASDGPSMPIRFGRNWTGPAFNVSSEHAQLAALDVLNGIHLNPKAAFPTSPAPRKPVIVA